MSVTTAAKLVIKPSSNTLKNRAPSSGVHTFLAIEPPHITPETRSNNRKQREERQMDRIENPNIRLKKKEEKENKERAGGENEDWFPPPKGGRRTNLHSLGRRRARATKRHQTKQKKTKRRRTKSMRKKRRMTRSTTRRR